MKRLVIVIVCLCSFWSFAQKPPKQEVNAEEMLRTMISARYDAEADQTEVYEVLYQFYQNPIDLTRTNREELEQLYLLTDKQIVSLLAYLNENGPLLTIYELQAVPEFDKASIEKILPFVEVSDRRSTKSLLSRIAAEKNHYFLFRADRVIQKSKGYERANGYQGSPAGFYGRYRVSHVNDFSFGVTIDQDNGEALAWNPSNKTYGVDFISAHAFLQNKGRFKQLTFGDFSCGFGQGLVFSSGFYLGKGLESITTVRRSPQGLRPYTSAMESGYFRGAGACYSFKKFEATLLVSRTFLDGKSGEDSLGYFETIYYSGYHRTANEIAAKNALGKYDIGGNLTTSLLAQRLKIGLTGLMTYFDKPVLKTVKPYNQYDFRGKRNVVSSLDFSYLLQNANIFGELAVSESGGKALLAGLIASLAPQLDFSVLYRKYDRDFHSLYGNAFGEATRNANEEGLYCGLKIYPHKKVTASIWFDHFVFPWLTYYADGPSKGYQYQGAIIYKPHKKISLTSRYRYEMKEQNETANQTAMDRLGAAQRHNYALDLDYDYEKRIGFRTRLQATEFRHFSLISKGIAVSQDIELRWKKFGITLRGAVFDTDDYNSRVYMYEPDVLYAFYMPAYYGSGVKTICILNVKLKENLQVWLRYAHTTMNNTVSIGSAMDEIKGNRKSEVKLQLKLGL